MDVKVIELAALLGVTPRRVHRLAKAGVLEKPRRHGHYDLSANLPRYLRHVLTGLQSHDIRQRRDEERALGRMGQTAFRLDPKLTLDEMLKAVDDVQ